MHLAANFFSVSCTPAGDLTTPVSVICAPAGDQATHLSVICTPAGDQATPVSVICSPSGDQASHLSVSCAPAGDQATHLSVICSLAGDLATPLSVIYAPASDLTTPLSVSCAPAGVQATPISVSCAPAGVQAMLLSVSCTSAGVQAMPLSVSCTPAGDQAMPPAGCLSDMACCGHQTDLCLSAICVNWLCQRLHLVLATAVRQRPGLSYGGLPSVDGGPSNGKSTTWMAVADRFGTLAVFCNFGDMVVCEFEGVLYVLKYSLCVCQSILCCCCCGELLSVVKYCMYLEKFFILWNYCVW